MRRILLLLALLPSLTWAATRTATNTGIGLWAGGTATWDGATPTLADDAVIPVGITVSNASGNLCANLTINGTLKTANVSGGATVTNVISGTNGFIGTFGTGARSLFARRFSLVGCSNATAAVGLGFKTAGDTNSPSLLVGNSFTGSLLYFAANTYCLVTNSGNIAASISGGATLIVQDATVTNSSAIGSSASISVTNASFSTVTTFQVTNLVGYSSTVSIANNVDSIANISGSNLLIRIAPGATAATSIAGTNTVNDGTISLGGALFTMVPTWPGTVIVTNGTANMASALTANSLDVKNAGTLNCNGYAHTATTILISGGRMVASNSTITVSNFTSTATFTHSGVTRLTAGGVFDSTNGATLSVVSGNVTLATNTVASGTIYSEAPGASLNLSGGTLTVTGQSLFSGTISNGVIGASAPVTAERTQGVAGRINSIEQMGAE